MTSNKNNLKEIKGANQGQLIVTGLEPRTT